MRNEPDFLSPDKCPECGTRMGVWMREDSLTSDVACARCGHEDGVLNTFADPVWLKPRLDETDHPPGFYRGFLSGLTGIYRRVVVGLRWGRNAIAPFWDQPTWFVREMACGKSGLREEAKRELALRENCVEAKLGRSPWWAHAYTEDGGTQ